MLRLIIAAACLWATIAQARSSDLSGEQINDLLAGATVEIDTPVGTRLPVRYGRDGRLFGRAGGLGWYLGAATDTGKWWVAGDQLCHRWSRWFGSEPQCLRLRKQGRIIRWRKQDGHSGTATVSVSPGTRVATVVPSAQAVPKKAAAQPETPPAPPKAPAPADSPRQPPGEVVGDAGEAAPQAPVPAPAATGNDPVLPEPVLPEPVLPEPVPPQRLDEAPPKQAEPKRATGPLFKVAKVRSGDVLNVRSGPSADFDIVGALAPGSRGIAITSACRSQWCPVRHPTVSGWVNSAYLLREEGPASLSALRDSPKAPRSCLTPAARALLERIERQFGPVQVVSTCRPGATVGTWRPSRHASGNAVDFNAGSRTAEILAWLIANHRSGGTMTYPGMDHIHVDIGPRFASIAGGPRWMSWRGDGAGPSGPR
jgi:Peptidase M15